MNRKRAFLALGPACIVVLVLALAGASPATPSTTTSKAKTFDFVFRFSDGHTREDLGAAGPSTGDLETYTGPVNDKQENHRVGFGQGHCVTTLPTRPLAQCYTTFFFEHGQISVQGPNYYNRAFNVGIVGGTGEFRSVRGDVRVAPFPDGEGWRLKLQVIR